MEKFDKKIFKMTKDIYEINKEIELIKRVSKIILY